MRQAGIFHEENFLGAVMNDIVGGGVGQGGCRVCTNQINFIWFAIKKDTRGGGGVHSKEEAFFLLTQRPQVWFSTFPKKYFDFAEIYWQCWIEESGFKMWIEPI